MTILFAVLNALAATWNGHSYMEHGNVLNLLGMVLNAVVALYCFIMAVTK